MSTNTYLRAGIAFYLVTAYIAAYHHARHPQWKGEDRRTGAPFSRTVSWIMIIAAPLSAAYALCDTWRAPLLPVLAGAVTGATLNVTFFYLGSRGVLRVAAEGRSR